MVKKKFRLRKRIYYLILIVFSMFILEYGAILLNLPPGLSTIVLEDISDSVYQFSSNENLNYELKSNFRNDNPSQNLHESFPYTNAHGQRDIERNIRKKYDRIILLGDSVVAGNGIYNLNHTISRQLEFLIANSTKAYEVLNFGVGGYGNCGEYELLKSKGIKFSPDIVMLMVVDNDLANNGKATYYQHTKINYFVKLMLKKSRFLRHIIIRFNLFNVKYHLIEDYRGHIDFLTQKFDCFNEFRELSEVNNFKLIVYYWPTFPNKKFKDGVIDDPWRDRNYALISKFVNQSGLNIIEISPAFKEIYMNEITQINYSNSQTPRELFTIGDGMHPNEFGSYIAAKILIDSLNDVE